LGPPPAELVPITDNDIRKAIETAARGNDDSLKIFGEMLSAKSIDELLAGALNTAAMVGVTFALRSWKWAKSTIAGGAGVFAIVKVVTVDGSETTFTTGSLNLMTALLWFQQNEGEKRPPLTVRHSTTGAGFDVYRFAKAA
jgi:hypothetical protein